MKTLTPNKERRAKIVTFRRRVHKWEYGNLEGYHPAILQLAIKAFRELVNEGEAYTEHNEVAEILKDFTVEPYNRIYKITL